LELSFYLLNNLKWIDNRS